MVHSRFATICTLMCAVLLPAGAGAQTTQAAPKPKPDPSTYDRIWKSFSTWYEDSDNRVIQSVVFSGRLHHDFAVVEADEGDHRESNLRRLRLGPRIRFFRQFLFHAEGEFNPQESDPVYVRMTDLYVQWSRATRFALTVGKQSVPFTMDGATSSKELIAIDRSNLANNLWFPQEYVPGISVSGRRAPWVYRAGVYSAGEANKELGEFNGGLFTLGVLGYDFAKRLGVKEALLSGNYVYQQPDARNTFTRRLQHVASVNFKLEQPKWGVRTDFTAGAGYLGQSDLRGFMVMPYFNLTDRLQLATRYTLVTSSDPNGVQLATYESRVVRGRGNRYDEAYVGANYYVYGHKLKLQTGLQFGDMDDRARDGGAYSGVSWTTALRVGWP